MKKYNITIDEKQMELVRVALESQAEVACDVAADAYWSFKDRQTDDNWKEYLEYSAEFHMATEICKMLKCAKGYDEAEQNNRTEPAKGAYRDTIPSEEFAREIDDFVDDELQSAMERIARVLYLNGYMEKQPHYGDFDDSSYGVRDDLVRFLQDVYGLAKSDGMPF